MNGFFETIAEQVVTVTLAGQEVTVSRARLGLHLRLGRLSDEFEEAPGSPEMAEAIRAYFEALGLDIAGASPVEILRAFAVLGEANRWQFALAFMKDQGPRGEPEPYDYDGRNWAWVVHKLASRYGWTRDYIFSLYPEEAAVYLQEILISEHLESEERYRLSELAYQWDSATKTSRYVPYSKPGWMYSHELPKPVRVLRAILPFGVVDLEGKEIVYH
jgi:hypothetical protein